jgi:serine/threonine protein phosphatase 1
MSRTLVIGDIHGSFNALKQVLERAKYDSKKDKLIVLGDLVDGWNQSAEVIQYFIDLIKEKADIIIIRGNHDDWFEYWMLYGIKKPMWVTQGGQATIDSYIKSGKTKDPEHRRFFSKSHLYYIDDKNRAFMHGGFSGLNVTKRYNYYSDYYWDRRLWQQAMECKDCNKFRGNYYSEVYVGHTSTVRYKVKPHYPEYKDPNQDKNGGITVPMNRCNMWNLDTGGGWYGKLTIMDIDTKEYWQSDLVKTLHPDVTGRE